MRLAQADTVIWLDFPSKLKGTSNNYQLIHLQMKLEKTAPNEIYLIVGDTDKDCNFNELAEVTWADKPIYEETAIKYVKSSQLTIPKSIADIIDGYCKHNFTADRLIMMAYRDYQEFNDWIIKDWVKNDNIARAYLAGKALGVDLVKVVADD